MSSVSHLLGSSRLKMKPQKSRGLTAESQSMDVCERGVISLFYMACHIKMRLLSRSLVYYDDRLLLRKSVLMKRGRAFIHYSLISDESVTVAFGQTDRRHRL